MHNYERRRQQSSRFPLAPLGILILVVANVILLALVFWPGGGGTPLDPKADLRQPAPRGPLADDELSNNDIYSNVKPSVVNIRVASTGGGNFFYSKRRVSKGTGSGFIWKDSGHVVTNYHVIRSAVEGRADEVWVTLADRSTYAAQIVGIDPDTDLAVLYVKAPKDKLDPIEVGTSADLKVGQRVYAIGNPFGLDHSLSMGIISALDRVTESPSGRRILGVIQTDAAINPGNSGGPLLDSVGRLIGVNAQIVSPSGGNTGIGFAIPVDTVNRVVTKLIQKGRVDRPFLGIEMASFEGRLGETPIRGVEVLRVVQGSPAAQAGLRGSTFTQQGGGIGDVIIAVDGEKVKDTGELLSALETKSVGDTVMLTVLRGSKRMEIEATLGSQLENGR